MRREKLERKLRKRAEKLLRWARKNGIDYATDFVMLDGTGDDYVNVRIECDGVELGYATFPEKGWETWS